LTNFRATSDPTLRLSATMPTSACSSTGGAPTHDLAKRYNSHVDDSNLDGINDLKVHVDTPPIGGDQSTEFVYLTGRFSQANGGEYFLSTAPVRISGN
jgi:hypothetical protein